MRVSHFCAISQLPGILESHSRQQLLMASYSTMLFRVLLGDRIPQAREPQGHGVLTQPDPLATREQGTVNKTAGFWVPSRSLLCRVLLCVGSPPNPSLPTWNPSRRTARYAVRCFYLQGFNMGTLVIRMGLWGPLFNNH